MNKEEFLAQLRAGLSGLPQEDIEDRISFYREMIEDRMEEEKDEEKVVQALGNVEDVVRQIQSEVPLAKIVRERIKPKRKLKAFEIVLIVLGSPVWLPLLIAGAAVVLSVYIVIWAMVAALYAVEAAFLVTFFCSLVVSIINFCRGNVPDGMLFLGAALIFGGLSVFLFVGCIAVTKAMARLTKWIALRLKTLFIRKEKEA